MSDETENPPDISSAVAISAPERHPTPEVGAMAGAVPVGTPRQPDSFMESLLGGFEGAVLEDSHGQEVLRLEREQLADFALAAKEAGFEVCSDITAVDWLRHRRVRFELVINLLSQQHHRRLRVLVPIPADDPTVSSVVAVWPGAAFAERETYDMYGIVFEGNPDLTRILMPDEWEGFPLRKDFDTGAVPVQFKDSHKVT